jgi:hypothetical protein
MRELFLVTTTSRRLNSAATIHQVCWPAAVLAGTIGAWLLFERRAFPLESRLLSYSDNMEDHLLHTCTKSDPVNLWGSLELFSPAVVAQRESAPQSRLVLLLLGELALLQ